MDRQQVWLAAAMVFAVSCGDSDVVDPMDDGDPQPDFTCSIPLNEIFSGGVGRDDIPALVHPDLGAPGQTPAGLLDTDRVIGVVVNGAARAYPFPVMWQHEVVNDTLGGQPVLVSYCPLTGTGIAFDPRIDGQAREFGVSGVLYRSNLMMFDRESESLWTQMLLPVRRLPLFPGPLFPGRFLASFPATERHRGRLIPHRSKTLAPSA